MRPHCKDELDVVIAWKAYKHMHHVSHIGLGVCALNNCKMLNHHGVRARVLPIEHAEDLLCKLRKMRTPPTHVIIQALWIPTCVIAEMAYEFPDTQFAAVCHSNVGFLQAEPQAITLFREYLNLERETVNFHAAGNSLRFCRSVEESFTEPCTYLPNMYWVHHKHGEPKRPWREIGGTLRIGIFGAPRVQKNILTGVMACIEIASNMGAKTEIYLSCGREDAGKAATSRLYQGARNLAQGLPNVRIIESPWCSWTEFLKLVGSMNLLLQPSYSESFNIVTADGCAEGVPSVVSSAITWAPQNWKADTDDASDIARVGCGVLNDPMSAAHGFRALQRHNRASLQSWMAYLCDNRFGDPI